MERDMHAWQQRINSIHNRQRQAEDGANALDDPAKRQRVDHDFPLVKRALFASAATSPSEQRPVASVSLMNTADSSGDDVTAEDDVRAVEVS